MRGLRCLSAGVAAASVLVPPTAWGATGHPVSAHQVSAHPVSCNLVRDPVGDTHAVVPGEDDSQLDLVGGDVATDARQLTAVVRLRALGGEDASAVVGRLYEFDFDANGHTFMLDASLITGGADFEAYVTTEDVQQGSGGAQSGTGIGALRGVIDVKRREIRFIAPLSLFAPYASFHQTYLDHLAASSYRAQGDDGATTPGGKVSIGSQTTGIEVDDASSAARYVPGARSCVTVGR